MATSFVKLLRDQWSNVHPKYSKQSVRVKSSCTEIYAQTFTKQCMQHSSLIKGYINNTVN